MGNLCLGKDCPHCGGWGIIKCTYPNGYTLVTTLCKLCHGSGQVVLTTKVQYSEEPLHQDIDKEIAMPGPPGLAYELVDMVV